MNELFPVKLRNGSYADVLPLILNDVPPFQMQGVLRNKRRDPHLWRDDGKWREDGRPHPLDIKHVQTPNGELHHEFRD